MGYPVNDHGIALALYQPDIPQNAGAILRMAACLAADVHIIAPAGFRSDDRALRRAGMDYLNHVRVTRHSSWSAFEAWRRKANRRLVLATTKAPLAYTGHRFAAGDIVVMGRESAGVPDAVHAACEARVAVPIAKGLRSLNVATAAAIILGEAIRQTGGFAAT